MGELSEPASPPKKRRLRRLIAACIVLLSLTTWWYWPRGDARFVGKWKATHAFAQGESIITLHRHGRGATVVPPSFRAVYAWRVEGNRLILGFKITDRYQGTLIWLMNRYESLTGTAILLDEEFIEILEVTPDVIRARGPSDRSEITLTRIRE